MKPAGRHGMVLKPEYQELADEFAAGYAMYGGCSCHINPPCGFCTHEGNPSNLDENDDAWEFELQCVDNQQIKNERENVMPEISSKFEIGDMVVLSNDIVKWATGEHSSPNAVEVIAVHINNEGICYRLTQYSSFYPAEKLVPIGEARDRAIIFLTERISCIARSHNPQEA